MNKSSARQRSMSNGHILLDERNSLSLLIVQIMCDSVLSEVIFKMLLKVYNVQLRIKTV